MSFCHRSIKDSIFSKCFMNHKRIQAHFLNIFYCYLCHHHRIYRIDADVKPPTSLWMNFNTSFHSIFFWKFHETWRMCWVDCSEWVNEIIDEIFFSYFSASGFFLYYILFIRERRECNRNRIPKISPILHIA